jgi:hypothetical protein
MNDFDDFVNWLIPVLMVLIMTVIGAAIGASTASTSVLTKYCESQSAQYEVVGGVDYCLKDNQLTQIEWME